MDPTIHTIIVGLVIGLAYHAGRYFGNKKVFEDAISTCLDKLERDGYLAVKKDKDGEKEWVDAWMKHLQAVPSDDVLQGDVEYGYDPSYPDC